MRYLSLSILPVLALVGCSAALVPASNDPYQLLAYADSLLSQGRPTPAERLINQALNICKERADEGCEAAVYRGYGLFFMSEALSGQWKAHYMENGFRDTTATYAQRYDKAIEWLSKAIPYAESTQRYDFMTNLTFNIALAYTIKGDMGKACAFYDESVLFNDKNKKANPNARTIIPDGYKSYADYIQDLKVERGCQ